jgi:rRNA maturation endonuclease Nob1
MPLLILIDAGALINSAAFEFVKSNKYLTTALVDSEIKDFKSRLLVQQAIDSGRLSIEAPKNEFLIKANEKLAETNSRISKADISVFALALQLKSEKKKFTVLTDDYSVQNALLREKIKFEGIIRGEIKKPVSFRK